MAATREAVEAYGMGVQDQSWEMSNMPWNGQDAGSWVSGSWRPWEAGRWNVQTPASPREEPRETVKQEAAGPPAHQNRSTRLDVLWHQVTRGEDWAALIARYNVSDPRALLAANGLEEARTLVPGEWVCVPCDLVRPVWELDPDGEGDEREEASDGK